jgi:hypothetical protein
LQGRVLSPTRFGFAKKHHFDTKASIEALRETQTRRENEPLAQKTHQVSAVTLAVSEQAKTETQGDAVQ